MSHDPIDLPVMPFPPNFPPEGDGPCSNPSCSCHKARADRDPWDPPAHPSATPRIVWTDRALDQMVTAVRDGMVWTKREDPAELARDLARKMLHEIRHAPDQAWVGGVLEQLWHRAESGVRYTWDDEPQEPADSLDPDPKQYRRGE